MEELTVKSKRYVVTELNRPYGSNVDQPNFMGTGKALVCVLNKGETVEEFSTKRLPKIRRCAKKVIENSIYQFKKEHKFKIGKEN